MVVPPMDYLVICTCGHTQAAHTENGCTGTRVQECDCPLDSHGALEAAIDEHRAQPWRRNRPPEDQAV